MTKMTNNRELVSLQSALAVCLFLFFIGCVPRQNDSTAPNIAVRWQLATNFTDTPDVFEAQFTLKNNCDFHLNDGNWALFFNMAPRPILDVKRPQAGTVHHINGDWYKLVPEPGFSLESGDSVNITYWGTEGVIKETDRPLGLYFVFYNEKGEEDRIAEVEDYDFVPFTSPDQINRNAGDEEPIPTPEWLYAQNKDVSVLPSDRLKKIIPTPAAMEIGSGTLEVNANFAIVYGAGLESEAAFLAESLTELLGREIKIKSGTESVDNSIHLQIGTLPRRSSEAYQLRISDSGISITGTDAAGVFYGIQSLRQLIPLDVYAGKSSSFLLSHTLIEDAPRFGFRGLHVDVSRNFQTKETILRILDLLSYYKINRFLFYTTEDEGWRLEIEDLPELTSVGAQRQHTFGKEAPVLHPAYGSGPYPGGEKNYGNGFYTRKDFVEILRYAKERHIKVIPELNFPGHARAAIKAMEARYDRLMEAGKEEEANEYRLIDPDDQSVYLSAQAYTDNVVSVARESTFRFYEKVVDEIAEMYTEAGLVMDEIHAGGDEVPEGAWTKSPMAAALMAEHPEINDPKNLQTYFFRELLKRLKKRNLRVDGWEEVALLKNEAGGYDPNPEFAGQNVVPFIWNNLFDFPDLGYRLANAGYPVVLCNVSNFYFDLAYSKDPKEPGLYWAGFVDTRDAWLFAPFDMYKTTLVNSMGRRIDRKSEYKDVARLRPDARKNILGLEAQLWSETIKGREMIEYYMLPKLLGFAESAWAQAREWETVEDERKRADLIAKDWNVFANSLGQRELPRLSYLNGGYNYRIPPPGGVIRNGYLYTNTSLPGLTVRYTTNGKDPDEQSPVWQEPVQVTANVIIRAFDSSGRSSRPVAVSGLPER